MIEKSENITNLAVALLAAQKTIGAATKGSTNPYFKSSYADLTAVIEAIKEPLNSNGITFLQAVDEVNDKPVIDTILLHESGQFMSSRTPVFCAKPNDPQAFGSGITYSKRYALQAMLGLPTEDDDGEKAVAREEPKANKCKTKPKTETKPVPKSVAKPKADDTMNKLAAKLQAKAPDGFVVDEKLLADKTIETFGELPNSETSVAVKKEILDYFVNIDSSYLKEIE